MTLTQEQYEQVMAVHDEVITVIRDNIYDFEEPYSMSFEEAQIYAESVAGDLLGRGFIALDVVRGTIE